MMISWDWKRRTLVGAAQAVGLGFLAGALEAVGLAATLHLPLGLGGFALLAFAAVGSMGLLAGVLGLGVGLFVHPALRGAQPSRAIAVQLGVVSVLLCGAYLWPAAGVLLDDGRVPAALAMSAMPLGFGGVVYFNAKFWLRRAELSVDGGEPLGARWLLVAGVGASAVVALTAGAYGARDTGGAGALDDDRNVLIVTVDGLRADRAGPRIAGLSDAGVTFDQAITPQPASRPAHATVLTGLHPLRHEVVSDARRLSGGYTTLPEILAEEGYATAAFVSRRALGAGSGLAQGFHTFDDDLGGALPGLSHLALLGRVLPVAPLRDDAHTVAAFRAWLDDHADVPFFAWVQLAAPADADTPSDYDAAVSRVDASVGDVLAAVDQHGLRGETLVILAGSYGAVVDDAVHHHGLSDDVVRVPLVMRAPGVDAVTSRVEAQVRLTDLLPTTLAWLAFPAQDQTEGLELVGYATGRRSRSMWTSLVGRDAQGGVLVGVRDGGVKYVRGLDGSRESLFDTTSGETRDLAAEQPNALEGARGLIASEVRALEALLD